MIEIDGLSHYEKGKIIEPDRFIRDLYRYSRFLALNNTGIRYENRKIDTLIINFYNTKIQLVDGFILRDREEDVALGRGISVDQSMDHYLFWGRLGREGTLPKFDAEHFQEIITQPLSNHNSGIIYTSNGLIRVKYERELNNQDEDRLENWPQDKILTDKGFVESARLIATMMGI